jgi:ribonuclease E
MDARPPRQDAPAPFEPSGNFVRRDVFDDEIDTTPTLDTRPSFEAPRRIDRPESSPPDEIDTTPQPIERPSELRSEQPPEPEQPRQPQPSVETEDPNRPKRSGWWQRKSFF